VNPQNILTPEQLAERLHVPPSWPLERTRARGSNTSAPLPFLKVGRYIRFDWAAVEEWLASVAVTKRARTVRRYRLSPETKAQIAKRKASRLAEVKR
jgi:hypothetical protein